VEFDAIGPVPLCGMILADMGADVVRIVRATNNAPYDTSGDAILHRGRTRVALDLKSDMGRAAALALIEHAEILIEGYRPGVMERLGLGPEDCSVRAPQIVFGRMTGWGQTGPLALRAGHDINYIATTGYLAALGEADRPPLPPLNLVGDYGGGAMFLLSGVLAALTEARISGKGQTVDAAMTDGVNVMMSLFHGLAQGGGWSEQREANLLDGGAPFYRCYTCGDGRHIAVGALEPKFFQALLDGLGLDVCDHVQHDRKGWPRMAEVFAARFAEKPLDAWIARFEGTDACVAPVVTLSEAPNHPQNAERAAFSGAGESWQPSPAPRFSRTPSEIRPAAQSSVEDILARWT
jgi:alpha-methylacyl-CoA racemase